MYGWAFHDDTAIAAQVLHFGLELTCADITPPSSQRLVYADHDRLSHFSVPTTDLDGRPVAALMLGIPGLDLSFSEPITISLHVGDKYDGYRMSVQSLLEGGQAWCDEKTVDVADGCIRFRVSHATRFAATPVARVSGMSPRTARRGALVKITGRYFGARRGVVRFGAVKVTRCRSWSAHRIVCRVPAKVRTGRLGVRSSPRPAPATRWRCPSHDEVTRPALLEEKEASEGPDGTHPDRSGLAGAALGTTAEVLEQRVVRGTL